MQTHSEILALRDALEPLRRAGRRIALVPTMGNLHAGHAALVRHAAAHADVVVVSIYVNPLQFNDRADLASYPRTLSADLAILQTLPCDIVFTPDDAVLYPHGLPLLTTLQQTEMDRILCGANREGHFSGVLTVVSQLFHIVQPSIAVFGEKDFQQCHVIARLIADLHYPIAMHTVPTQREADGLAMSSRNQRLSPAARAVAPELYQTLQALVAAQQGLAQIDPESLTAARARLEARGFTIEYLEFRTTAGLQSPSPSDRALHLLAAVHLDGVRLIDNLACNLA